MNSRLSTRQGHGSRSSDGRFKRSRYTGIPTTNQKFETFIDTLFESREATEDIKDKIVKYV
jgi:hypothetical protein